MAEVVVSEFITQEALDKLRARHLTHYDPGLWERPEELCRLLGEARGLIVRNRTQVRGAVLDAATRLEVIGRLGVGLDNIDVAACEARGIEVCPARGANASAVAEYVIAAALILLRGAFSATGELTRGGWPRERLIGRQIEGKRLGLIGYGSIGQLTGHKARALGMEVAAYDPGIPPDAPCWSEEVLRVSFDEAMGTSDVISLHLPLTHETRGLIGAQALARMKRGAILINTARGGIVDEAALAAALREGVLGGAALDVFSTEPVTPETGGLFAGIANIILTPHIAGVTEESNALVSAVTADNVLAVLARR